MRPKSFIVKLGKNKLKEYTRNCLVFKVKTRQISFLVLVYNHQKGWLPLRDTPGFRTLCSDLENGMIKSKTRQVKPSDISDEYQRDLDESEDTRDIIVKIQGNTIEVNLKMNKNNNKPKKD
jgi:hypothetical protein